MTMSTDDGDNEKLLAVLQFLKKKNLNVAEEALRKEAGLDSVPLDTTASDVDLTNVLSEYESSGDPLGYTEHYSALLEFIETSLDANRHELSLVSYPVFVHLYLAAVYKGYEVEAEQFYKRFISCQESYRMDDLRQLLAVRHRSHMRADNDTLLAFRSSKYVIRMSRDSFNLLKKHLQSRRHGDVLLNILQQHFQLDVFDGRPRSQRDVQVTGGFLTGEAPADANQAKILYGLPHEPELNAALLAEDGQASDDEPEAAPVDAKSSDKSKKKRKKDDSKKSRQVSDPNAPKPDRVPFPRQRDTEKRLRMTKHKAINKQLNVSADKLPSVCFYTLMHASGGLNAVEISDDSSLLAAGFADSSIKLWSLTPRKLRALKSAPELARIDKEADDVMERIMSEKLSSENRLLLGHTGAVFDLSFNPEKSFLLSSSADGTARLWSLHTYTCLVAYRGHLSAVWGAAFSPHGYYFVTASHDGTARLWATDNQQPIRIFAGHHADVFCVDWHANCNYIATGSADRAVRMWDVVTGAAVRLFSGHRAAVLCVRFSPDGKLLASAGADARVMIWTIADAAPLASLECGGGGSTETISALAWSRDGAMLAAGGVAGRVRMWDVRKMMDDGEQSREPSGLVDEQAPCANLPTKSTPIHTLHFTWRNLLLGAGDYHPPVT